MPGTTWDYWEEALTWPRLMALHDEWAENPPTHLVVATAYLTRKSKIKGDPADLLNQQNNG